MKKTRSSWRLLFSTLLLLGVFGRGWALDISVVGSTTLPVTLLPGERYEGKVDLRNNTDSPREAKIYLTDYLHTADGKSDYAQPGSTPRSTAPWVSYTPHQLTIPGGATMSVYYSIQLPKDEPLTGSYWCLMMVEPLVPDPVAPVSKDGKPTVSIKTVIRYALKIVTTVGDTGKTSVKFSNCTLRTTKERDRQLLCDLTNTGERWLPGKQCWVELFDKDGKLFGRYDGVPQTIFPGQSERQMIDLPDDIPSGSYTALLVADFGDDAAFGAQFPVPIP